MKLFLILFSALVVVAAACGGGDDDEEATPAPDSENTLAAAMVLTLDELPPDWTSEPPEEEDPEEIDPFEECDPGEPVGKTGEADSHDFAPSETASLSQEVAVFVDVDSVQAAFEDAGALADCLEQTVNDGGLDSVGVKYFDASVDDLDLGEFGDDSRSFRVSMTAQSVDDESDEAEIFIDVVLLIIDRVGMTVQVADAFSPYDKDVFAETVETAEEKVRAVLAQDGP